MLDTPEDSEDGRTKNKNLSRIEQVKRAVVDKVDSGRSYIGGWMKSSPKIYRRFSTPNKPSHTAPDTPLDRHSQENSKQNLFQAGFAWKFIGLCLLTLAFVGASYVWSGGIVGTERDLKGWWSKDKEYNSKSWTKYEEISRKDFKGRKKTGTFWLSSRNEQPNRLIYPKTYHSDVEWQFEPNQIAYGMCPCKKAKKTCGWNGLFGVKRVDGKEEEDLKLCIQGGQTSDLLQKIFDRTTEREFENVKCAINSENESVSRKVTLKRRGDVLEMFFDDDISGFGDMNFASLEVTEGVVDKSILEITLQHARSSLRIEVSLNEVSIDSPGIAFVFEFCWRFRSHNIDEYYDLKQNCVKLKDILVKSLSQKKRRVED